MVTSYLQLTEIRVGRNKYKEVLKRPEVLVYTIHCKHFPLLVSTCTLAYMLIHT